MSRIPGAYGIQKNTTVLQALSLAGGVTENAAMNRIQIIRIENGSKKELKVKLTDLVRPGRHHHGPPEVFLSRDSTASTAKRERHHGRIANRTAGALPAASTRPARSTAGAAARRSAGRCGPPGRLPPGAAQAPLDGITAFLLVVVGVTVYTFTATPIFEARTRLLIESDNPNVLVQGGDRRAGTKADYYQTQYNILQSRALARQTLDEPEAVGRYAASAPDGGRLVRRRCWAARSRRRLVRRSEAGVRAGRRRDRRAVARHRSLPSQPDGRRRFATAGWST